MTARAALPAQYGQRAGAERNFATFFPAAGLNSKDYGLFLKFGSLKSPVS
jgi:hypothetical protein